MWVAPDPLITYSGSASRLSSASSATVFFKVSLSSFASFKASFARSIAQAPWSSWCSNEVVGVEGLVDVEAEAEDEARGPGGNWLEEVVDGEAEDDEGAAGAKRL